MFPVKLTLKRTMSSRLRTSAFAFSRPIFQTAGAKSDIKPQPAIDKEPLPFDEIPGPKGRLTAAIAFYRQSKGFREHHKLAVNLFKKYGPIFKEHVTDKIPVVHVMEPNDFETVFRAEGKYPRRPAMDVFLEYSKKSGRPLTLESLNDGEWHRLRQVLAPKVMRPKVLEENIDNFNAVTKDAIDRMAKIKGMNGEVPDLEEELSKWATESVGTYVFDARIGLYEDPTNEDATRFIQAVHDFFDNVHHLLFGFLERVLLPYVETPSFKKVCKAMDTSNGIFESFVDKKIKELEEMANRQEHSQEDEAVSLLSYLLAKTELSGQEITNSALTVFGGGVDTTAGSATWLLYNLARHPEVQEKLYQEVIRVVGREGVVSTGSLAKMSYVKACVKESSRLNPLFLANKRILPSDVVLSGYSIPAQTAIQLDFYPTVISEKHFKNALEFNPERWLRENKRAIHPFAFLPFGYGPRMCLGSRIAELELHLLAAQVCQRFRMEYNYERLEIYQKFSARPDRPVKIKFIER